MATEIEEEKKLFRQREVAEKKQRKLLASKIGKMAVDFDLNLAIIACKFVVSEDMDLPNS